LERVWNDIKRYVNCYDCPLKNVSRPLLFEGEHVNWVKVMVVTEGPNEEAEPEFIASMANHPTFTFLQALFKGNFKPRYEKHREKPNVYWTHVRKCFLKTKQTKNLTKDEKNFKGIGDRAAKICSLKAEYLRREIEALKPKLIVAVGGKAVEALFKYSKDKRLHGKINELVFKKGGIFSGVKIGEVTTDVIVVPHPSGKSKETWVGLAKKHPKAYEVLENISLKIVEKL